MLNWGLIKHPMNWVTIFLMLAIAAFAGHLLLSLVGFEPATSEAA